MSTKKKLLEAAAGNAGEAVYVEDVFSTYLYEGNGFYPSGGGQTITNGIDLDGEGGMIWIKARSTDSSHGIYDTERGINQMLGSNLTAQEYTDNAMISANSDGFTLGAESSGWTRINLNGNDYASWTFRKQPGFFDIVTYTGNAAPNRTISHNLGSVPGMIIIKKTSGSDDWIVHHRSAGNDKILYLNTTTAELSAGYFGNTDPTSTEFTVSSGGAVNANGQTYVAYLFAHDAQDFGTDEDESIIKCGSYTGNGSTDGPEIDLGWEPQFIMVKSSSSSGNWIMLDSMRGVVSGGYDEDLYANLTYTGTPNIDYMEFTATGFIPKSNNSATNGSGSDYIYMAIRRPMKTPESGTEVFAMDTLGSTGDGNQPGYRSSFPVDMGLKTSLTGNQRQISTRLLQGTELLTESTAVEAANASKQFDYMNGTDTSTATSSVNMMWMLTSTSCLLSL
jgi:hypothetical protein